MKTYIDKVMNDWLYQPHIRERVENKTFIEDGPIVLNKLRDEEYFEIPVFSQVYCLCEFIINEGPVKLTLVGNLPQKVVFKLYSLGVPDYYYEKYPHKLRKETDSFSVHLARLLAEVSGLVKIKSNSLYLTRKGEKAMNDRHLLMKTILIAFGYKLSWGYFDGYEEKRLGQQGFALTLLLIARDGSSPRLSRYYSDRYFYHFNFYGLYEYAHSCFSTRTFRTFLHNLGLVTFSEDKKYIGFDNTLITKSALFDKLITIDKEYGKISYSYADAPLYRLRIGIDQSSPFIWREFIAPSNLSLENFHVVIQGIMGWSDSHLHQFIKEGINYTVSYDSEYPCSELEFVDYNNLKINDLLSITGESIKYEYDFGDGWMHTVELLEILDGKKFLGAGSAEAGQFGNSPGFLRCLDGANNCPHEDSGGIHNYLKIIEILKDPLHEEYEEILEWVGKDFDPEYFDLKSTNNRLATFCHV